MPMLFLPPAIVAALLAQESASSAPSTSVATFGCGGPSDLIRTDFYEKPGGAFKVVAPPADRQLWMHRKFEGFDEHEYGLSSVELVMIRVLQTGLRGT